MIEQLKDKKMFNFIPVKHLVELPLDHFADDIKEDIIIDHDMNMITIRLDKGNRKALAVAMTEMAKELVK